MDDRRQSRKENRWARPQRVEVAGRRVAQRLAGINGAIPVDLEPGFLLAHHSYVPLAENLAWNKGCVSIGQRPGFGAPSLEGPVSIEAHAEFKKERLQLRREELGDPNAKFVLVGDSLGTAINTAFAARHPEYVDSILDTNGVGDPQNWTLPEWQLRGALSVMPVSDVHQIVHSVAHPLHAATRALRQVKGGTRNVMDLLCGPVLHPLPALHHGLMCTTLDTSAAEIEVGKHGIPVTIVRAEHDYMVPRQSFHNRADRMNVPAEFRIELADENHLCGTTMPWSLKQVVAAHLLTAAIRMDKLDLAEVIEISPAAVVPEGRARSSSPQRGLSFGGM